MPTSVHPSTYPACFRPWVGLSPFPEAYPRTKTNNSGPRSGRREAECGKDRDRQWVAGWSGRGLARSLQVEPTRVRGAGRRQPGVGWADDRDVVRESKRRDGVRLGTTDRGTVSREFSQLIPDLDRSHRATGPIILCHESTNQQAAPGFVVDTYEQLVRFVEAFAAGHLNLLILLGQPGLAKSQTVRQAMPDACWIEGNATAFGVYTAAWHHRDRMMVLDDVDSLYADRNAVRLLKCLCQTDPVKRVSWQTASATLDKQGIPRSFETSSRVIIIANQWKTLDRNVAAVQDRGHVIRFEPTAAEVHRAVRHWFDDEEIYDWFGRHLSLVVNAVHATVCAGRGTESGGSRLAVDGAPRSLASRRPVWSPSSRTDARFTSEAERVREFVRRGGGCRATYFNHAKRLRGRITAGASPENA